MDTPSSAYLTINFSARKILIVGYYHILYEFFLYNEAGTEGNKEDNDEGFSGHFHQTDFDDGKFNNNNKQFNNSKFNSNVRTLSTLIRFYIWGWE